MKTTYDYTGRTSDISIFPSMLRAWSPADASINPPSIISGKAKASQRYLRALFTPSGHFHSDPDYGSNLSNRLFSGEIVYAQDIPNVFAVESLRVLEYLYSKDKSKPLDEKITRSELESYSLSSGVVSLVILLFFDEESPPYKIILPVKLGRTPPST